jgi:hypothetical protein
MHVKTRVTITLDPRVIRRAKSVARSRRTNLSALIEGLLVQTAALGTAKPISFSKKWAGKLSVRESDGSDPLLDAMKTRYGLK